VLFGSDIPFHHPKVEIDRVRLAGLAREVLERVLSSNGRALFLGEGG
jgi:predicted TIM-barrel fold metal-dependent hydrolase